jgi:hypothetical protein
MDAPPVWAQRHPDLAYLGRGLLGVGSALLGRLVRRLAITGVLLAIVGLIALYQSIVGR